MWAMAPLVFVALATPGLAAAPLQPANPVAILYTRAASEPGNSADPPEECRAIVDLPAKDTASKNYVPVRTYDPRRNAIRDVQNAVLEAHRTGRNVLIQVGGEWCDWCRILDSTFQAHPQLLNLRDANFVTVTVNYSDQNKNKQLLDRLPDIPGYPHLFVLNANGELLVSQNTYRLEQGNGYNPDLIDAFLRKWSPQNSPVKCPQDARILRTSPP